MSAYFQSCTKRATSRLIVISAGDIVFDILPGSIPIAVVESTLGNPAILSSVGARLLINMKEAGAKGLNEGTGSSSASKATVSGMNFAVPPAQTSGIIRVEDFNERDEEIVMVEV